jgi:hypothetical protein
MTRTAGNRQSQERKRHRSEVYWGLSAMLEDTAGKKDRQMASG